MHPTCCLEFWRVYTHTCVCIYHFGSSHFGSSHFGSRRFGSRGLKRVPPWVPGRPGTPMEPALLTLSGVEVAGATDGAFVSLSVASWLRLGGEVALARNSPRAEAGAPAASSAAAAASPAEPASAPCYERSRSYSDCSEPAAQRSPSRSRSPPARLRPRHPSPAGPRRSRSPALPHERRAPSPARPPRRRGRRGGHRARARQQRAASRPLGARPAAGPPPPLIAYSTPFTGIVVAGTPFARSPAASPFSSARPVPAQRRR